MSVTALHTVRFSPIFRALDKLAMTPGIVARWIGMASVACDASGGLANVTLNMGGAGELYGPFALWDLQICTVEMDAVPLSTVAITIAVNTYEAEGGGYMEYKWNPALTVTSYYQNATANQLPTFKFRSSDVVGQPANIRLTAANIVAQKWYLNAGGFVYDERML